MKGSICLHFCLHLFARPEPVLWFKDGGDLPDIERMIVEGRELTITTLNKTDNGTYRCEASNHVGTSSAEYTLFVYGGYFSEAFALLLLSAGLIQLLLHSDGATPNLCCSFAQLRSSVKNSASTHNFSIRKSDIFAFQYQIQHMKYTVPSF